MSDTVASPSALPEVAYPPAISLGAAWPWMLFGFALLGPALLRGRRRGSRLGRARHLGARVGPRRAPPPRLPLPLGRGDAPQAPRSAASSRGSAEACWPPGSRASSARAPVGQAIAFEEQAGRGRARARRGAGRLARRCRRSLGLLTAALVYGLALRRPLRAGASPPSTAASCAPAPRARRIWLAAFAFVAVFLVPFVKYPANPPATGDPDTIGKRTAVYVVMIAISLLGGDRRGAPARACWPSAGRARPRRSAAGAGYLAVVVVAGLALPSIHEVPADVPGGDAVALPRGVGRACRRSSGRRSASCSQAPRSAS